MAGKNEVMWKGKIFDLKVAKVVTREDTRLILDLHCDDDDPFDIEDQDEFVTLFVPRIVIYDTLVPPIKDKTD